MKERPFPHRVSARHRRLAVALTLLSTGVPTLTSGASEVTMEKITGHFHPPNAASRALSTPSAPELPTTVAGWKRTGDSRRIAPSAIFEYMDGAGELYLAYRLDHLDVIEYRSDTAGDILVELYAMGSSDDAFGLLSGDWGGEPVETSGTAGAAPSQWPRALYGSGLLRIWSDNIYARVLASRESDAARAAVLALGRAITKGRGDPPPPRLSTALPTAVAPGFRLRPDRLCFFRSHLVLNSVYFLGQRDMLELGPSVEAVSAPYERPGGTPHGARPIVLAVHYPDADRALQALARFRATYLPDAGPAAGAESGVQRIEDGWVGYRLSGASLALVFEGPDGDTVEALLAAVASGLKRVEVPHE